MPLPQKIRFDGETATLTVSEFRAAPGDALDRVARGMEITVTKNGKPVAVISPPETVVNRDGSFTGRAPLTFRQPITKCTGDYPNCECAKMPYLGRCACDI